MKQIKTIDERRDRPAEFDRRVNQAISEGWKLIRRYVNNGLADVSASIIFYPVFVAELEREVPDAE